MSKICIVFLKYELLRLATHQNMKMLYTRWHDRHEIIFNLKIYKHEFTYYYYVNWSLYMITYYMESLKNLINQHLDYNILIY